MKSYRRWQPTQSFLFPPSPADWLPDDHLAFFVLDVVAELDISEIERAVQGKDSRGERPYSPRMMLGLLIYGYCTGVFSSRKIQRATYESVAFRVLAGGEHPFHTTIADFRRVHLAAFKGLFLQVLMLCQKAGLVKLGHVALDGSKVQGNASKHKAMSYDGMQKAEKKLKAEVDDLVNRAKQADTVEDKRLGVGVEYKDLPSELARREDRLAKIAAARAALEAEARKTRVEHLASLACEQATASSTTDDQAAADAALKRATKTIQQAEKIASSGPDGPPASGGNVTEEGLLTHRTPCTVDGLPTDKAQRNFTDPDSRIMKAGGGYVQGYNCQQAVDGEHQIIVAQAVTNQGTDNGNLQPMLEQVLKNMGAAPTAVTADTGYWNPEVADQARALGSTAYVSVGREKNNKDSAQSEMNAARQAMAALLSSDKGAATYRLRKAVVEPVHGQIKEVRGFRRFHLRGLFKVRGEWSLVCLGHNLLKLFRHGPRVPAARRLAAVMA